MIGVTDLMLMIYQTKVSVFQLHIVDIPDVPRVIADQSHTVGIRNNHCKLLPIDCLQLFRGKNTHHHALCSAII